MFGKPFQILLLLLSPFLVDAAAAAPVTMLGVTYHMGSTGRKLSALEAKRLEDYKNSDHCAIWAPGPVHEPAIQAAIAHLIKTLNDPGFVAFLNEQHVWTGPKGSADPTQIVNFLKQPRDISIFLYERTEEHPCKGPNFTNGDGNIDAFTPLGKELNSIFLNTPFLDHTRAQPNPEIGMRNLAKTILHESLHVLGYLHELANPSASYNSTVPVYVGCAVMHWSPAPKDQQWVRTYCGKSLHEQKDSAYRLICLNKGTPFEVGEPVVHTWLGAQGKPLSFCAKITGKDGAASWNYVYLKHKSGREETVDACIIRRPKPGECPADSPLQVPPPT